MSGNDRQANRGRRLRISLRTVFSLFAAIAILLGWRVHRVRQQEEAVAILRERGASVAFDYAAYNFDPTHHITGVEVAGTLGQNPAVPQWIGEALSEHFFIKPIALVCIDTHVSDDDLKHIGCLRTVRTIALAGTRITDAGLVHLQGMRNLRAVGLERTQVSDKGVEALQEALSNCKIHR